MQSLIKILIEEEGIRRTPSIYLSILLAYLETYKWNDVNKTLQILESLDLLYEEKQSYLYLKELALTRNRHSIQNLFQYLYS